MINECSEPLEGFLRFQTKEIYFLGVLQVPKMDGINEWLVTPNFKKCGEEITLRIYFDPKAYSISEYNSEVNVISCKIHKYWDFQIVEAGLV